MLRRALFAEITQKSAVSSRSFVDFLVAGEYIKHGGVRRVRGWCSARALRLGLIVGFLKALAQVYWAAAIH